MSEYLGKKAMTGDHVPAVANFKELACLAKFSGAIGDCTRVKGHSGNHQGAHGYMFTQDMPVSDTPAFRVTAVVRNSDGELTTIPYLKSGSEFTAIKSAMAAISLDDSPWVQLVSVSIDVIGR